jgi:hypothetical protein
MQLIMKLVADDGKTYVARKIDLPPNSDDPTSIMQTKFGFMLMEHFRYLVGDLKSVPSKKDMEGM